jgi:hypothetical protein
VNGHECRAKSEAVKAEERRMKQLQKQKEKEAKEQARIQVCFLLYCAHEDYLMKVECPLQMEVWSGTNYRSPCCRLNKTRRKHDEPNLRRKRHRDCKPSS